MTSTASAPGPITALAAANEQHMLFLFLPITNGKHKEAAEAASNLTGTSAAAANAPGQDFRATTGVHFSMFYLLPAGAAPPALPVPTFQAAPNKGLLVAMAIYDADFGPYIQAFVDQPAIAAGLNFLLTLLDETDIVTPDDPTSAAYIMANGGVVENAGQFYCLLMRYNFGDPILPGAVVQPKTPTGRYLFGATFPGLTVGSILQKYPDAATLWPASPPAIVFAPSNPPQC